MKKRSKNEPEATNDEGYDDVDQSGQSKKHVEVDRNGNIDDTAEIEYSGEKKKGSLVGYCGDITELRNLPLPPTSSSGTADTGSCGLNDHTSRDLIQQQISKRGTTVKDVEARLLPRIVGKNGIYTRGSQQRQQHQRRESHTHPPVVNMSSCLPSLRRTIASCHIKERVEVNTVLC